MLMFKKMTKKKAQKQLENKHETSKQLLNNPSKLDDLLRKTERKLKRVPFIGKELSLVWTLIELVRSYAKKEYTDIPYFSVVAIVSALLYLLTPIDMIPDVLPFVGHVDDLAVITFCKTLIETDIKSFVQWRSQFEGK